MKNQKTNSENAQNQRKQNYNPNLIELKWQKKWEETKIYSPDLNTAKKPFYNLMMFPYPSAEGMHVGNMYAFTGADVYGRFQRMQGKDVFEPIGLDGFGIHSENYAIKQGTHPAEQAKISEEKFYKQLRSIGNGFDWTRTVETYKPDYYKWTQWLFVQLFKAGLAYRKKAPVNFCPSCKTVLADEQVITKVKTQSSKVKTTTQNSKVAEEINVCERCETEIEKKSLEQWFFKITKYADRLLNSLSQIDWSEKVKTAQREWIGKSEGTLIRFKIEDLRFKNREIEVFTTRADTLYGATFLVLAPEHFVSQSIKDRAVQEYIKKAKAKSDSERIGSKEKTGIFSGLYAINPLNQGKIPVWIADYAIMGYGTGALFGDAHDERDVEFANKYGIALKPTLITGNKKQDEQIMDLKECFTGYGILVNSGEFSGLKTEDAKKKVTEWLSKNKSGGPKTTYHLRDWLISRQRYWGPPIPLVSCENCAQKIKSQKSNLKNEEYSKGEIENPGWVAVGEKDLPVELPFIKDYKPLGTGVAPLASHPEFYKTSCPKCGGSAKRETDVSDTFLDSAWYFLRYVSTDIETTAFDRERVKKWLPVNMYIGGAEHSVLHLLYSRFVTMALHDMGIIGFEEPFTKFRAHGLIVKDGAKMSKSKGNVVIPDAYIKKFGADTLRTYLMFMGPYSQGGDFRDSGIEGMHKFLKRVWRLISEHSENSASQNVRKSDMSDNQKFRSTESSEFSEHAMHKAIKRVTEDIKNLSYNTAIAALMEYYNFLSPQQSVSREEAETFLKLLAPFAPHMAEELWERIKNQESRIKNNHKEIHDSQFMIHNSIHLARWPAYDEKYLVSNEATIVVQINGKLRDAIKIKNEKLKVKSFVEQLASESAKVKKYLDGKEIKKVIYVEGKVINFVVE